MTPPARAEIQDLLKRLAEGDRAAIEPAFTALWPLLRGFAVRALGDAGHAEDAAQQAMIKLFQQVSDFDPTRDGVAWALAITSFEVRSRRRWTERRREEPLSRASGVEAASATPEASTVQRDLELSARQVLSGLREEDMCAILLELEDARPAGDPTFRKRLQRALARLRQAWKAKHETP
jgi:RNA polymerase sigma-70 factor, ECF subfamily